MPNKKQKLSTYGVHPVFANQPNWITKEGWYLTDKEPPATKLQQELMEKLGWGKDNSLTIIGANTIIKSILETLED